MAYWSEQGVDALDLGLTTRADGSPVRLRRNGRTKRAVGLYFSVKSGRHLPYESRAELHDLWCSEVSPHVVSSWPQPFTMKFVLNGDVVRYTPDRKDVLEDGAVRVVEVKDELISEPLVYHSKLAAAEKLLAERGMGFVIRKRHDIEAEPQFSAVAEVQRLRRTRVLAEHLVLAQSILSGGATGWGELCERLGHPPVGCAIACALVARRAIAVDLREGLHDRARVELVRS